MARVERNETNIRHCRCPQCPVQDKSECAKGKMGNKDKENLNVDNAALLYCAIGKSVCNDLNGNHSCICPSCLVWEENNLSSQYYCLKGSADEIA